MPMLSNVKLHMSLLDDCQKRGEQHVQIGKDMLENAKNMLAYAQCHCAHEFIKPLPAYAHEGGVCKHCRVNELYAPTARKTWLAMENNGTAPWGPRGNVRPVKTKALADVSADTTGFTRDDQ